MAQPRRLHQVLIVGHSHARRLGEFLRNEPWAKNNFGLEECHVEIKGVGGWRIQDWLRYSRTVPQGQFDIIVVFIGDNDIKTQATAEEISYHLMSGATMLLNKAQPRCIVLCPILPRLKTRFISIGGYNEMAQSINKLLAAAVLDANNIELLPLPASWTGGQDGKPPLLAQYILLPDGIHLNNEGQRRLYKAVRQALLHNRWVSVQSRETDHIWRLREN